jgi:alcohol dehydrogenase class IV
MTTLEAAELSADAVEVLLETIGVSYRLEDYGVKEEDIDKLAEEGLVSMEELSDGVMTPNPRDMTLDDIKGILEEAL